MAPKHPHPELNHMLRELLRTSSPSIDKILIVSAWVTAPEHGLGTGSRARIRTLAFFNRMQLARQLLVYNRAWPRGVVIDASNSRNCPNCQTPNPASQGISKPLDIYFAWRVIPRFRTWYQEAPKHSNKTVAWLGPPTPCPVISMKR